MATVVMATGLPKLATKNNYESDLPGNDDIISQNRRMEGVFGKRDELIVVVCAPDVLQARTLGKIRDMTDEVKEIPGVVPYETWSLSTVGHVGWHEGNLKAGPLMRDVPDTPAGIEALREEIAGDVLVSGRLVSRDFTRAVIVAHLGEGYRQSTVARAAEELVSRYRGPEEIYLLGDPIIGEEVDRAIEGDIKHLFPLALALMLALFFLFFRTAGGVLLPAGVIVLSVVWTMGLAGHIGFPVTVVTSAIPVLLVAVASSYGIHVVHGYRFHLEREKSREEALARAMKSIRKPVVITGLTSAAGSITLMAFRVTSIREFGILAAAGFIFAMVLALTFVPASLRVLMSGEGRVRPTGKGTTPFFRWILEKIKGTPLRRTGPVLAVCVLAAAVSAYGISRLRVGMDPVDFFPEDFPFARHVRDFDDHFGGARKMFVMVESTSRNVKDPSLLNEMLAFQRYAEEKETVGGSISFADVIRRTNLALNENDPRYDRIPASETRVAQAALVYASATQPEMFESIVSHDFTKTKITLDVRTSDVEAHAGLYRELKEAASRIFEGDARVVFGGLLMIWIAQIRYIVLGKLLNIALTLLFLIGIGTLVFRSWKIGVLSVIPVSLALLLDFGIMGYLGIRLNMATAIITAMGAGIGIDFSVHYLFRLRDTMAGGKSLQDAINVTVDSSGKAILVDMASNVLGFSVFVFSPFEPVRQFGWLICVTMVSSAAGALVLVPACIGLFNERERNVLV